MSRKNGATLPSVDDAKKFEEPVVESAPVAPVVDESGPETRIIEVPYARHRDGYNGRHVQVQLNDAQAEILNRVFRGLDESAAKLDSGRYVSNTADVFRWLLEKIGTEA